MLTSNFESRVLYQDNHIIIVNKLPGEIVQADQSGDSTLLDLVKSYLKTKYNKPGNVFLGPPHRLDRPTSGLVVFAKTDKALSRLSQMFRLGQISKYYLAIVDRPLVATAVSSPAFGDSVPHRGTLTHYIYRDTAKNKSFAYNPAPDGGCPHLRGIKADSLQLARLEYEEIGQSNRYTLLRIHLLTGRHHQIRAQLAACNVHIKGDLKYGFPRSNPDGGICLHSREISFIHPVSKQPINVIAPVPTDRVWTYFNL